MKKSEILKIRTKKISEIKKLVVEKRNDLLKYISELLSKKNKNIKKIWKVKKELAIILTILSEKEREANKEL